MVYCSHVRDGANGARRALLNRLSPLHRGGAAIPVRHYVRGTLAQEPYLLRFLIKLTALLVASSNAAPAPLRRCCITERTRTVSSRPMPRRSTSSAVAGFAVMGHLSLGAFRWCRLLLRVREKGA
jgi:hypothetical protein